MQNEEVAGNLHLRKSRVPTWFYLTLAVIVPLVALLIIFRPMFSRAVLAPESGELLQETFTSETHGFSLRYPVGWRQTSDRELGEGKGIFAFAARPANGAQAFFGVRPQNARPGEVKLDELAKTMDGEMAQKFKDFEKIGHENLSLGAGIQGLQYDYVFTSEKQAKIRARLVVILAPSQVFHLTGWAPADSFESVSSDFDEMVKSFQIQ